LVIGLGNPGAEYAETRHNAGFWLLDRLASQFNLDFKAESKFFGQLAKGTLGVHSVLLLKPMTYMNKSGQSVLALAQFYKVTVDQILIVHDELDLEAGQIRLKRGGGHGGHNGLRDLHRVLGADYARIRVGIGHPGHQSRVHAYVLSRPPTEAKQHIDDGIDAAVSYFPDILAGTWDAPMNALHQR
jgi:PTH1 family peptidyl-tRNA hydrolase